MSWVKLARSGSPKPERASSQSPLPLLQQLTPQLLHASRDDDEGVADVEIANLPSFIQAPPVPGSGGKAHLASGRDMKVTVFEMQTSYKAYSRSAL